MLFLAVTMQPSAWAQPGGVIGPNGVPIPQGQNIKGMHIFLWGGLKSHGEGQHDYPQFVADWSKILTDHGAVVDAALHTPSAADLEHTDVVILYKGDAGYLNAGEKATLDAYVKRGGGFVNIHDSLCGPDPEYMASILGAGKKHFEVNYSQGALHYTIADKSDPIMKEMSDITVKDEAFFLLTWARNPPVHVLATVAIPATRSGEHTGEIVPQMWTWEHTVPGGQPARAFVWMQGHYYPIFTNYQIQQTLFRGIAWAGKKPVDELINYVPPARPAGRGMPGMPPGGREMPSGGRGQ
jgi:type 1 glutamine amidotransferase